jgi:hypothetical protein
MAAKQVIIYRGHTIRMYEKSFSIDNEKVQFINRAPVKREIFDMIDGRITNKRRANAHYRNLAAQVADWDKQRMRHFARPTARQLARGFWHELTAIRFSAIDLLGATTLACAILATIVKGLL